MPKKIIIKLKKDGSRKKRSSTPRRARSVSRGRTERLSSRIATVPRPRQSVESSRMTCGLKLRMALRDPFDQRVDGVRMCDSFRFPTSTFKLHGTTSISTPAGSAGGSFALFPHPLLSYIDVQSWTGGLSTTSNTAMTSLGASNPYFFGAATPSALAAVLSTYRVVACGFKIRVQTPQLSRTGRLMIAPIALTNACPPVDILTTIAIHNASGLSGRILGGVPVSAANTSSVLSLDGSFELSLPDMDRGDIQLIPKPCSSSYQDFHTARVAKNIVAGVDYDDGVIVSASGAITAGGITDPVDMSGHTGFLVHFEGVPVSSPIFDVEYIFHLEGTPTIATASSGAPVPSGGDWGAMSSSAFNVIMDAAAKMPWGRMVQAGMSNLGVSAGSGRMRIEY